MTTSGWDSNWAGSPRHLATSGSAPKRSAQRSAPNPARAERDPHRSGVSIRSAVPGQRACERVEGLVARFDTNPASVVDAEAADEPDGVAIRVGDLRQSHTFVCLDDVAGGQAAVGQFDPMCVEVVDRKVE